MKTITLIFLVLMLSQSSIAQTGAVGTKRHIADKGVPPSANITELNIPDINNNSNTIVVVNEVRNAQYGVNAIAGVVNTISTGYNSSSGKHYIKYDDSNITMQAGRTFNIAYAPKDTAGSQNGNIRHKAESNTIFPVALYNTVINNSLTNNDGSWKFMTSKYFGDDEVFNDFPTNLYYDFFGTGEWSIQCHPTNNIPINAEYNLIGDTTDIFRYDHITSTENIDKILMSVTDYAFFTVLNHPFINSNPDAIIIAEPIIPTGSSFAAFFQQFSLFYNETTGFWELHIDFETFPGSDINFPNNITFKIYASNETTLSTAETPVAENIKFYPNPTNNNINIETHKPISEVVLFNPLGQKMETIKGNGNNNLQIDVSNYSDGYYFAKIKIEDIIKTIRIIKN